MGMPTAAAQRQPPLPAAPTLFLTGTAARPAQPRPAPRPATCPPPAREPSASEPRPGRCGTSGQGASGAGTLARGQGTGAPGDPQHRRDTAAAAAVGGYLASSRAGAGGDRAPPPLPPPPPAPLAPTALRSARCARVPLPGDRHCQAESRPLRAGIGCWSRWLRPRAAPSRAGAHAAPALSPSRLGGSGAGRGFLRARCAEPSPLGLAVSLSWASAEMTRRPKRREAEKTPSLGENSGCCSSGVES